MARIPCPKCGAVAKVMRVGRSEFRETFNGDEFIHCQELPKIGEPERLLGDCSEIKRAIQMAIANGRV